MTVIMKVKQELVPKLSKLKNGKYYVFLWYQGKRFRYYNANALGESITPNTLQEPERKQVATLLLSTFIVSINNGWRPENIVNGNSGNPEKLSDIADFVLERKLKLGYSKSYKQDLIRTTALWNKYIIQKRIGSLKISDIEIRMVQEFVYNYAPSPESMANLKRNISSLLRDELEAQGVFLNFRRIKLPRVSQELHKPINDVEGVLNDIAVFNDNLYICCLLTFALLLRPHREIRCLTVGDFNSNFTLLSLNGKRVKSKKNRIVPVPHFVQKELLKRYSDMDKSFNLFSRRQREYHQDYFKNRWSAYKKQTELLEEKQTLYSFRHTGAIKVFEKTGSLQKLQQVLGHSDMKVSLTYLRGLEVKQLNVEDLPEL